MKLKAFLRTLDGLDKNFYHLYEKTKYGYILQVEDTDYKSKLDELIEQKMEKLRVEYADKFKKLEERASVAEEASAKYEISITYAQVLCAILFITVFGFATEVFSKYPPN